MLSKANIKRILGYTSKSMVISKYIDTHLKVVLVSNYSKTIDYSPF